MVMSQFGIGVPPARAMLSSRAAHQVCMLYIFFRQKIVVQLSTPHRIANDELLRISSSSCIIKDVDGRYH